jgi:hypothetical protein
MLRVQNMSVKRPSVPPASSQLLLVFPTTTCDDRGRRTVAISMRRLLKTFDQFRTRHRRRLSFLAPALERRRPRIAAEDYAARHSIEHTLDRKAELRRLAPTWPPAARRYHQLLTYELDGLREVVKALHSVTGGRELEEALAETSVQIERLEIEIAWCTRLLDKTSLAQALLG